jgi:hypothetical protein
MISPYRFLHPPTMSNKGGARLHLLVLRVPTPELFARR